jgi:hypothetical protein
LQEKRNLLLASFLLLVLSRYGTRTGFLGIQRALKQMKLSAVRLVNGYFGEGE